MSKAAAITNYLNPGSPVVISMAVFGKPKERHDSRRLQHEDRSPFLDVGPAVENSLEKTRIGSLIDPKKKKLILERIKDGKGPLFMEKKPAPERSADKPASEQSQFFEIISYDGNDLGKYIELIMEEVDPFNKWKKQEAQHTDYLTARKLVAERGWRLPSNVLHESYVQNHDAWMRMRHFGYYYAWAREIVAYPASNGMFEAGRDIMDEETNWIIPASFIPQEAIGVKDVGLFIDPEDVSKQNGRVIVIPRVTIVLTRMIQGIGDLGGVNTATGIPHEITHGVCAYQDSERHYFGRADGMGVRPIVRGGYDEERRWTVETHVKPDKHYGVGGVKRW